ncbi:MAG: hypothetical protein Q9215_007936, partial [Flavoplaca cf. flavocitrina]
MAGRNDLPIYSATYSNVPVYEFNLEGNHVMRRRQDNWINATHILKVAKLDKPARTRILEREVQKGIHEKVQGGYGKYQGTLPLLSFYTHSFLNPISLGTWVPLQEGRLLAQRNGVLGKLLPFFDFVPGPISPPQAPKHQTAASNKGPKAPRPKKAVMNSHAMPPPSQMSEDFYDGISNQLNDDESMAHSEIGSESFRGEEDGTYGHPPGSRKRKRGPDLSYFEQQHTLYADALLDYFMLSESDRLHRMEPPQPPHGFVVDKPIDEQGHTALHWGAAMGDIETIRMFINRGAHIDVSNVRGETPLIRAVLFTNNHEKETMPKIVDIFLETIMKRDKYGATVLHHVAMTTKSSSRKRSARYYLNVLLTKLGDILNPQEFAHFLEARDNNGDTAIHIVARHNAKKCVREFQGRGVSFDIPNENGETAAQIMHRFHAYRVEDINAITSSSPGHPTGTIHPNNNPLLNSTNAPSSSFPAAATTFHYETQSAQSFSTSFGPTINSKALQVTLAMEDELQQMDASLTDATRLVHQTTTELHTVRQKTANLTATTIPNSSEESTKQLTTEKDHLTAVCESMLELEQYRNLHAEVAARELEQSQSQTPSSSSASSSDNNETAKLAAAHALAKEQARRRELSRELVQAQAMAGMSEKGEMYKRLIAA